VPLSSSGWEAGLVQGVFAKRGGKGGASEQLDGPVGPSLPATKGVFTGAGDHSTKKKGFDKTVLIPSSLRERGPP